MKTNIFIPNKIKVGYQERSGTYTGKLAYVIYYDVKGVLRKETSWQSWRNKNIEPAEFENIPTEGFVLNKKVGDYVSDWNHRQAYVRVYDPRGFEFEITVENLLFILENTSSIKGKGLEGEFVYSWDGKELVLLPVGSANYKQILEYNDKIHNGIKLKGKDLILGATYLNKDNKELVYLGRFDYWDSNWKDEKLYDETGVDYRKDEKKGRRYYFKDLRGWDNKPRTVELNSLSNIISIVAEEPHEKYAEWVIDLMNNTYYNPIDRTQDKFVELTLEEFIEVNKSFIDNIRSYRNSMNLIDENKRWQKVSVRSENDELIFEKEDTNFGNHWSRYSALIGVKSFEDLYQYYKPLKQQIFRMNGQLHSERINSKW